MAKKRQTKRVAPRTARPSPGAAETPAATSTIPAELQQFIEQPATPKGFVNRNPLSVEDLRRRLIDRGLRPTVPLNRLVSAINRVKRARVQEEKLPEEVRGTVRALKPDLRRFHGAKLALTWFPFPGLISSCADRFGYMSPAAVRDGNETAVQRSDAGAAGSARRPNGRPRTQSESELPQSCRRRRVRHTRGVHVPRQFVDHDITFDISSSLNADTDANTINNMRSPGLDLDSLYSRSLSQTHSCTRFRPRVLRRQ